jgi:carbonic anhydrase/acetyltransferase-like protein (isoleucine patch superfamily)
MAIYSLDDVAPELPADGDCFVADSARVIGRVRLHARTSVWFNAVLRGDNELIEIGEGSNVQDNCTLHTDEGFPLSVGENCIVGHNVILHGCTIADNVLIGMGAVVMNGARIGRNCVVGAGAIVTEGKTVPDYSLILGAPARVVRTLDPKASAGLFEGAAHYVANGRRFRAGLKQIG